MRKILLLLIFNIFFLTFLFSQDTSIFISGKVIDVTTNLPLNNVSVFGQGTLQGTITNANGYFEFSSKQQNIVLAFSFLGYEKAFIKIAGGIESQPLEVRLVPKTHQLGEVIISSNPLKTVAKSKSYNILDYGFYDENILLIVFKNNLSKSNLILINSDGDTLDVIAIPEKPLKFFKDCLGYYHIVEENNTYQIYFDSVELQLGTAVPIPTFEAILLNCLAEDDHNLYFKQTYGSYLHDLNRLFVKTNNHKINYYYINKKDKSNNSLKTITDVEISKLIDEEQKYLESKEKEGFYLRNPLEKEYDRIFAEKILYKEIYAPLFKIKDSICIFNYQNSMIEFYSAYGKLVKEVNINYHLYNEWKPEMFLEERGKCVFVLFEKNGITTLRPVSIENGILLNSYKIPYTFVENIKVKDNYIYFLYKGQDSSDTKFLSRLEMD